ncbi:N-acetylglucosamine-6-phosphate deacetylase [Paenirhodobacter sp.]|uniref:N-acetylglucosamine-6-phosphate deacetylase n=1 Tax=Paenirhodobacter sp. TaxID=1965326 RepID=UPI003B50E60D
MEDPLILTGARVFDGSRFVTGDVALQGGRFVAPGAGRRLDLGGGVLAPGLIDLQVNGGGGIMLDGDATVERIATICAAHARLGTTGLLPTLITDSRAATQTALAAGIAAVTRVPGFLGLHLEGPHIDPRRPGCHPPGHIRPIDEADMETLLEARTGLPALMLTLAPAAATPEQIGRLAAAGIFVSLGHAEASMAEAAAAVAAGARGVTHLFNAMSQLGAREPGMVGAALSLPVAAGLIADGVHVAPEVMRLALRLAGERIYLVSDAMAVAGTDLAEFPLAGRRILRRDGALRLENGTLAGADLSLPQAVRTLIGLGVAPEVALAMASSRPAALIGHRAEIAPGLPADLVHFDDDWRLTRVWQRGQEKSSAA